MNLQRSQRLAILQCFIDTSPIVACWKDMNSPNVDNEFYSRLSRISGKYDKSVVSLVASWKEPERIISDLVDEGLVTEAYSETCLSVDLWFLLRDKSVSSGFMRNLCTDISVEYKLLFQVILQSLIDLQQGRPCDYRTWRDDVSPDFRNCTQNDHICWKSAEDYLLSISSEMEECVGLNCGCIEDLVTMIKKDRIFKILSIFNPCFTTSF